MPFYYSHLSEIEKASDLLSDDRSRILFTDLINFRLTGRIGYLENNYDDFERLFDRFDSRLYRNVIDAGAYNGDSSLKMLRSFENVENIFAFEPDKNNFKRLVKNVDNSSAWQIKPLNYAVSSFDGNVYFNTEKNRNSSVVDENASSGMINSV